MPSPRLYLHVGINKTGSSFIQSLLAVNAETLAAQGLVYPDSGNSARARAGDITTGNLEAFTAALEADTLWSDPPSVYSSEIIFERLRDTPFQRRLAEVARPDGVMRILLLVRDPVAHAASAFQQSVKGLGHAGSVEAFFDKGYSAISRLRRCIDALSGRPGIELVLHNYSAVKRDLSRVVADWLGVPVESLTPPPRSLVNRSLGPSEIRLQQALNAHLGASPNALANLFCNLLPGLPGHEMLPSVEVQNRLWDRCAEDIAAINALLPAREAMDRTRDIQPPVPMPSPDAPVTFLPAQIDVIAQAIARPHKDAADLRERLRAHQALSERQAETIDKLRKQLAARQEMSQRQAKSIERLRAHQALSERQAETIDKLRKQLAARQEMSQRQAKSIELLRAQLDKTQPRQSSSN